MKVKETAKKPYGICPASMTIWNADQTYNKKGILGSYALRNNMFDVGAMLLIAVIGYFFLKLEIPIAPIVLALILGPLAESNLRRSLLLSQGSAADDDKIKIHRDTVTCSLGIRPSFWRSTPRRSRRWSPE